MRLSDRIGRRIKLQDLHILMTVVQAGSMGKAARQLNTSQPNISKSIADLEHALGVRLLDRHRQGIEPTEFGHALLGGGTAVFDELRQTLKNIEFLADPSSGEIRVGCTPLLAASFASAVVDRLSQRHPGIVFHLVTGYAEALHQQLHERKVDFLIARQLGPLSDKQLSFEYLFHDTGVIAVGSQSAWARRRKITLAEIIDAPWVLSPPASGIISIAMQALAACGLGYPRATVITDSPEVRMSLLGTGRFLTIFPASALRFPVERSELKILPIELPMKSVPNGVVMLKNRTVSPVARLFIDTARDVAKPLAKGHS
ncbi:LysR family transcriptional regulator [Bradyrhizobium sp.]|uniref:LysR family transcriptional regulator n=1 Tax=Bradyrhizobium sp. TaxID=376 RepID=UPI003C48DFEA